MVRIRRSQTRRTLGRRLTRDLGHPIGLAHVGVVDAVEEGPDHPGQEVTVGAVAERLGIDPSRASRLVADAIQAGYVLRVASQTDGRRIRLELTDPGRELARTVHRHRQAFFADLTHDWTEQERADFARLLTRFTDALTDASTT
ncbi:MAG TPA: MarR family winged helix-turn-helix transcriptional regulator [Actinomycetes bacterium]|jgi:DNA-binding MarR family transcriptional regulator|nr:MarR family winged helix-turn-helix transcriptional regulator [Actinomycetes bacterium]